MKDSELCPACGFPLGLEPWRGEAPSEEVCPSCGIQFGYDDADPDRRQGVYRAWREEWIESGMQWWSADPEPSGWDPESQVRRVRR